MFLREFGTMGTLIHISDAATLALHAMVIIAARAPGRVTALEIARELDVSLAHLLKVLRRLVKAGLLLSSPGPGGGFSLAKKRNTVTLRQVYEAVEGTIAEPRCLLKRPVCGRKKCMLGEMLEKIYDTATSCLGDTTLEDVVRSYCKRSTG